MSKNKEDKKQTKVRLLQSKLSTLLDITTAINANSSKEDLFNTLRRVLFKELGIAKFVFYYLEDEWHECVSVGVSSETISSVNISTLVEEYSDITVLGMHEDNALSPFDVVIPIYIKKELLAYLLLADLENEKITISPIIRHLHFIQTLCNIIVVALENKRLVLEQLEQLSIKKDLELAQRIQSHLFPPKLPNSKSLKTKAYYKPHREIGGDYYDVIKINDNETAICVADLSGKGISAALLMANFQANLRVLLPLESSLEKLIKAVNKKVVEVVKYENYITLFIAIYNQESKMLHYINAGHQAAILIQNGKPAKFLIDGCTVLGMFDELEEIKVGSISLDKNDRLYCYTDGISELYGADQEHIESEGIKMLVENSPTIEEGLENIISTIENKENKFRNKDDITLLAAQFLA